MITIKRKIKRDDLFIHKKTGEISKATESLDLEALNKDRNYIILAKKNSWLYKELLPLIINKTAEERKLERSQIVFDSLQSLKKHEDTKDLIDFEQTKEIIRGLTATIELLQKRLTK